MKTYAPNTGGIVRNPEDFDVSGDVLWLGSRQVARFNPALCPSERDYYEHLLTAPAIAVIKSRKTGDAFEAEDFLTQLDDLKKKLKALAECGLVKLSDVERVVDDIKDEFGLE